LTLTYTNRWRIFVSAAFAINLAALLLVRSIPRAEVRIGAALDVAVTVPVLYLLLIVRAGLKPVISGVPLMLLGLLRATWLAPGIAVARPVLALAAEFAVVVLVVPRLKGVLASELAVFRYAFVFGREVEAPAGSRMFTIHEQSGVAMLFGFLAGVSVMEAGLVHLLLARWSARAAWVLTALSLYGAIWLIAVARSFARRPVVLASDELILRAGILWTVRVPLAFVRLEAPGGPCDLRMPPLSEANIVLRFDKPVTAHAMYGLTRRVTSVGLAADDVAAFRRVLGRPASEAKETGK
jgi:hypothetical protein